MNRGKTWANLFKGSFFLFSLFLAAASGSFFLMFPLLPLLFVRPRLYRSLCDRLQQFWFYLPVSALQFLFGVKFVVSGDAVRAQDRASLFLPNHRTRLDWLYLWSFFFHHGRLQNEKIVLKAPLKRVPGFGWAMQQFAFLFLERERAKDLAHMHNLFGSFGTVRYPVQFLLFPEGTDLCPSAMASSLRFSKKEDLPAYKHVLHPRTGAFLTAIKEMRGRGLDAIYDISMGYPDVIPQGELGALRGNYPYEIHIHVKRFAIDSLPTDDQELERWLKERWQLKEKQLADFYERKHSLDGTPNRPDRATNYCRFTPMQLATCLFFSALWFVYIGASIYALATCSSARLFALFSIVVYTIITIFFNGSDHLEVKIRRAHGLLKTHVE